MIRYRFLSQKSLNLVYEAARSTEYSLLMDDALELFDKQLKDKICTSTNILSESAPQPDVHQDEAMLSAARLKKKEVQPRSSKRHRSWLDKTRKYKKKVPNKTTHEEGGCNVESQVPPDNSHVDCKFFTSFRDLLTDPSKIDDMPIQDLL